MPPLVCTNVLYYPGKRRTSQKFPMHFLIYGGGGPSLSPAWLASVGEPGVLERQLPDAAAFCIVNIYYFCFAHGHLKQAVVT